MPVPEDNPLSDAKIELGRHLFYDKRLSGNQTQSCASCHQQDKAFTDGLSRPTGSTGAPLARNAPSLANVAYMPVLTWVNPLLQSLEQHAMVPLFADLPVELGVTYHEDETLMRLQQDGHYQQLFEEAFSNDPSPFTWRNVIKALASFQRTLLSFDSAYDHFIAGDVDALSAAQRRGMALFNSPTFACSQCHAGFNFTRTVTIGAGGSYDAAFVNPGLYSLDETGAYPAESPGLAEVTDEADDEGRFRIPSLRNVVVTAPYMHDGSVATLDEVLDHYARGGRAIASGPDAGDGALNPNKDHLLRGFVLTPDDRRDLIAFLESLTDDGFLTNPMYSDPFRAGALVDIE